MMTRSLARGTVVEKINSQPGDSHPDGARGRVLGPVGIGYWFIEWNDRPGTRWFVPETKIREVKRPRKKKPV
jgi:hypothetical protein